MRRPLNIAIVGYGIAGIAAAIRLRDLGHQIEHFERADGPRSTGAGMLLHPSAQRALQELDVLDAVEAVGAPVTRIHAQTTKGKTIVAMDYPGFARGKSALGIQRSALHRVLAERDRESESVSVRYASKIVGMDTQNGFLDEESGARYGPFDLIVVADGVHSALRKTLQGSIAPDDLCASAALVGLLPSTDALSGESLTQFYDGVRHLSVWPAGTYRDGESPKLSFAINVQRDAAASLHMHGAWKALALQLCPALAASIEAGADENDFHVFSYRQVALSRWEHGRAICIGDAAHAMSPLLGLGAQLAIEDAALLADAVAGYNDPTDACRSFARTRSAQLRPYQSASRWLTPIFHSEKRSLAMVRDKFLAGSLGNRWLQRLMSEVVS